MNKNKYYMMTQNETSADIVIYGDITSWPWYESDVSSYILSKQIAILPDSIKNINVYINSYGGEVAEGLAIANTLKRHPAFITTFCDGAAASIAAIIFAAGTERIMSKASLLFVHTAQMRPETYNAQGLRKTADDLDIITNATIEALKEILNIPEEEIKSLMAAESWLGWEKALNIGFVTSIIDYSTKAATASVKENVRDILLSINKKQQIEEPPEEPLEEQQEEKPEENNNKNKKATMRAFFNVINGGIK